MNNVVGFVSKSELERERLIHEARAIYDGIFPQTTMADGPADGSPEPKTSTHQVITTLRS